MIHHLPVEVECQGEQIRGTVYRRDGDGPGRGPAVVLLHGFTGSRVESGFLFVHLGRALARAGIAAITFDFRGSGESDGAFDRMLVTGELADALRISQWAPSLPYVDRSRLGLLGFSLGGLVAGCTVGRTDMFKALALLAPTTVENLCRFAGGEDVRPVVLGPLVLHGNFFNDVRTLDPLADVVRHPRPTLLVQGDADTAVTPEVSEHYIDAMQRANVPLDVQRIADGEHTFSEPRQRKQVISLLVDFFTRQLQP